MKPQLFVLAIFLPIYSFAQIPDFESNNTIQKSLLYQEFYSDYKFILGYTRESNRYDRKQYSVLTYNGTDWELKKWSFVLSKEGKTKKSKLKSKTLDKEKVNDLLNELEFKGFYTLNQDSLNRAQKDLDNGIIRRQSITDGFSENFEIISQTSHRIYSVDEPELKQKFIFSNQRQRFLECINRFLNFTKASDK